MKSFRSASTKIYLIIFLQFIAGVYTKATTKLKLQQLFSEKGLPGSIISCIYQDSYDYMWFGIESAGIYRYDGVNLINYQHSQIDTNSLINNFVNVICEDEDENLWVGTTGGLDIKTAHNSQFNHVLVSKPFNDQKVNTILKGNNGKMYVGTNSGLYSFSNHLSNPHKLSLIPNDNPQSYSRSIKISIRILHEDSDSILWVGTSKGLFMKQNASDQLFYCAANSKVFREINITSIAAKNSNELILGAYEGVFIYNKKEDWLKQVLFPKNSMYNRGKAGIRKIVVDNKNRWWIASMQYGLICVPQEINKETGNIELGIEIEGLQSTTITDIFLDKNQNIWVASKYEGLYLYDKRLQIFEGVTLPKPKPTKNDFFIMTMCEDKEGQLWVGTRSHGIFIYRSKSKPPVPFKLPPNAPYSARRIEALKFDSKNNLWIGTIKGFYIYSLENKGVTFFKGNRTWVFEEVRNDKMWIGSDDGIFIYNYATHELSRHTETKHQEFFESKTRIGIIKQTQSEALWFGTFFDGLFQYFPKTDSLIHHRNIPNINGLSDNSIRSFYEDSNSNIWIGTRSQGLNKYNTKTKNFEVFLKQDGLASNAIYNIIPDRNNNIWLGTDMGLVKFNTVSNTAVNYNDNYGLPTTIFEPRSGTLLSNGEIAFGFHSGVVMFNPDSIKKHSSKNKLIITSVTAKGEQRKTNIFNNDSIVLNHDENYITFDFALLDYVISSKNRYQYKLEGFDKNWNNPTIRNYTSYTNLLPGNYTFLLRAANFQNDWNLDPISISIKIKPPFWKTNYAYFIYVIVIIILFVIFYWIVKSQIDLKHRIREVQRETQKTIDIEESKIEFFTNIAHEFQTPLTLILAPIEKLTSLIKQESESYKYVQTIQKNSTQLLKLIEQLLFFRKVQSGVGQLELTKSNIIEVAQNSVMQFMELAKQKNIGLNFNSTVQSPTTIIDTDKIEKVISNLIMNSIKYSSSFGRIDVNISDDQLPSETISKQLGFLKKITTKELPYIKISVKDNGKGMSASESEIIFNRYFQKGKRGIGAGIGLDLAKTLTELHGGKIKCISEPNKGSEFIVWLPLKQTGIETINEHIISKDNTKTTSKQSARLIEPDFKSQPDTKKTTIESNKPVLLIVDDNQDLLKFLAENLNDRYEILTAENGQIGYQLASQHVPDIIISDVSMPELDGLQLCKLAKEDFTTCHIPFIMLTAKSGIEDKLSGLQVGADEYIEKPFNLKFLELKILRLLQLRNNIQKQILSQGKQLNVYTQNISVYDKEFLNKINNLINTNLSNSDYSVEKLSVEIGLSRAQLNRKLKALINQSPMELIYSIRLEEAKRLLTNDGYNVTDVAHMTGFKSPSSFSTVFKNKYGYPPSNIQG